jgi:hypothetical protein
MGARYLSAIVIIASLAILGGCGSQYYHQGETPLEKNWGRAFESAKYNQTLNPEASENLEPVDGLDGAAAEIARQRYLKGEEKSKPETTEFGVVTVKQQQY